MIKQYELIQKPKPRWFITAVKIGPNNHNEILEFCPMCQIKNNRFDLIIDTVIIHELKNGISYYGAISDYICKGQDGFYFICHEKDFKLAYKENYD